MRNKENRDSAKQLVLPGGLRLDARTTNVIYTNDGVAQETIRKRSPSPAVSSRPLTSIDNTVKEKTSCSRKEGSSSEVDQMIYVLEDSFAQLIGLT